MLVTCYNDPLAGDLAEQLSFQEGDITVAPILRHLESQLGRARREPEDGEDLTPYWEAMTHELFTSTAPFERRFETIVVDEAQDFDERWIQVLDRLLPDEGGKLLMVADPYQDVRGAGARLPTNDDGWAMALLASNYRNSPKIADFMRQRFEGAGAAVDALPLDESIEAATVSSLEQMTGTVDDLLESSPRPASDIWVLTTSRRDRDHLREELGLRAWEDPEHTVVCETVRRLKGLDAPEVILVSCSPVSDEHEHLRLLYAGISRAIDSLTIVGSEAAMRALSI